MQRGALARRRPGLRVEQRLHGEPVGDGDEVLRRARRRRAGRQTTPADEAGDVAAELAIGVSLGSGELGVAGGLRAEGDRHHPVAPAIVVDRQRSLQRGHQGLVGVVRLARRPMCPPPGERCQEREQHELALVGEVVRERAGGEPRLGCHVPQRGCFDAGSGDDPGGSVGECSAPFVDVDHLGH